MGEILGAVASGHKETSNAARLLLEQGGNAFDAALGAMCAACVCEPMLASLGGGGFLLAREAGGTTQVFDFFTQTPSAARGEIDFYPIEADFGTARQEFHIGMGSIAVPGVVAGLFEIHRDHCRLPLQQIIEPAVWLARKGVRVNALQRYISEILQPIIQASPDAMALAASMYRPGRLAEIGEFVSNPELADTLEMLARHGSAWFYEGEPGQQLASDCARDGGLITLEDLRKYRVIRRTPVTVNSHGARISVNSPPSPGGCLMVFALSLLDKLRPGQHDWGSRQHALALAKVMQTASLERRGRGMVAGIDDQTMSQLLDTDNLERWYDTIRTGGVVARGTTHMSVADREGNLASLTLSNGEGSSYMLPGHGVMLNNMLGEEDLNPLGFHRLPSDVRLASMMTPTLVQKPGGGSVVLGSGGSNRIRSAILQVLANLLEFDMTLELAVRSPRLHLEGEHLSIEEGFSTEAIAALQGQWPGVESWPGTNLFFGGVHAVERHADGQFDASGDHRRGGVVAFADSGSG